MAKIGCKLTPAQEASWALDCVEHALRVAGESRALCQNAIQLGRWTLAGAPFYRVCDAASQAADEAYREGRLESSFPAAYCARATASAVYAARTAAPMGGADRAIREARIDALDAVERAEGAAGEKAEDDWANARWDEYERGAATVPTDLPPREMVTPFLMDPERSIRVQAVQCLALIHQRAKAQEAANG